MRFSCSMLMLFSILCSFSGFSQKEIFKKTPIKFGEINVEDFAPKVYSIDSNAPAVILADIGSSKFEGNVQGDFSIVYKRFQRIRIINKNGFDFSKFEFILHNQNNNAEKLENLEAVTYNLENGQVVPYKLDKSSIFKSEVIKDVNEVRFTLPNIKEGSIIECRYTITSPFYQFLRSWTFQGEIPRLWSEYEVSIPSLFNYVISQKGFNSYTINDSKTTYGTYNIVYSGESANDRTRTYTFSGDVLNRYWAIKDVPSFKMEPFISSPENYIQKIDFQMKSIKWPDGTIDDKMGSWESFVTYLLGNQYFGKALTAGNLDAAELDKYLLNVTNAKEKANAIFKYVRDNFTCTEYNTYYVDNSLKKVYQSKKGNVAEINLLLIRLLKNNGFEAQPVILSTRENGIASEIYPMRRKFNHVISRVKVNDKYYLLDASDKLLGFGILNENQYNGSGRVIANIPILIPMITDSLKENKHTYVFLYNDSIKGISGSYRSVLGTFESIEIRKKIRNKGLKSFTEHINNQYGRDFKIADLSIDSLEILEKPVEINYSVAFNTDEDLIYLNPLLSEQIKENPFKSAERLYPVEMPYSINNVYTINIEIPKGYKIEELPKSALVKLNGEEGYFEYMIGQTTEGVQLRNRLVINKANFLSEDYKTLREFYGFMVKKQSEMIVFKKIK